MSSQRTAGSTTRRTPNASPASGSSHRAARRFVRCLWGVWVALGIAVFQSALVSAAAADLQSTNPIDGASVKGPLGQVVLTFAGSVSASSTGIAVFHLDGSTVRPANTEETATPEGGTTITLTFDPGLDSGTYGVRWSVESADGVTLDGQFQFTVATPPTTTTPSTLPATVPTTKPTTPPLATLAPSVTTTTSSTGLPGGSTPSTGSTVPGAETTTPAPTASSVPSSTVPDTVPVQQVDDDSILATLGQALRFGGAIAAIGAIAALLWVVQSDKQDISLVLTWIRMFGLVVAIGGVLGWARVQGLGGEALGDPLLSLPAIAALLAGFGGLCMTFGLTERHSLAPVGNEFSWRPGANSAVGLFGALLTLLSFGVVDHQAIRGPQSLLGFATVVHVAVVSVWAGGVFALTLVAWIRRQRRVPARTALAIVRFSPIATWSLVLATITGVGMDVLIADSPTEPTSSPWGRMLVVKLILVAIAIAAGGFNRFALQPAIQRHPDDPDFKRRVRVSLTIESVVFVMVIVVTVALVTLNPSGG